MTYDHDAYVTAYSRAYYARMRRHYLKVFALSFLAGGLLTAIVATLI